MKLSRLEQLYSQKLVPPGTHGKVLPLEQILKSKLLFYPDPPPTHYDILEIGPGRGDFLLETCRRHPEKSIVAVEIGRARYEKLVANAHGLGIKNLTLICGDARIPVETHFTESSFESVFVLFPDPWPRNKHRHKRLLQTDFLKKLISKIKPGGQFLLVTDVADYASWCAQNLETIGCAARSTDALGQTLPDEIIPTFFSEKWKTLKRQFFSVRYVKTSSVKT